MIQIDMENGWVSETTAAGEQRYPIGTAEAFSVISKAWLRSGWDNKYVYSFAWMGRPVIQLPPSAYEFNSEDLSGQYRVVPKGVRVIDRQGEIIWPKFRKD